MQWIIENWIILLIGVGMLAMHLFGHGHGHGRKHGAKDEGQASHPHPSKDAETPARTTTADRPGEDENA